MIAADALAADTYHLQKRRVYVLAFCQALFLTCAVASVSVAAIVGADLAPRPWMTTLPYGLQFAVVVLCAYSVSRLMGWLGRRRAFMLGTLFSVIAGFTGFVAIRSGSFSGLIASHVALGAFIAHANFYRFAATDDIPAHLRAKALSLVTAGGVLAGILAPFLTIEAGTVSGSPDFSYSYLLFSAAGALSFILLYFLPEIGSAQPESQPGLSGAKKSAVYRIGFFVAVYCAGVGYLLMNLLMVQSSLVLSAEHRPYHLIGVAIQLHVVSMFVPSFFTGSLINRLGNRAVLAVGFILLALSGAIAQIGVGMLEVTAALIALGVAWNFLYVGGSAYLTLCHDDKEAAQVQGINDTVVSALAAFGALMAGALFHWIGWLGSAMLTFPLVIVGLILLTVVGREASAVSHS